MEHTERKPLDNTKYRIKPEWYHAVLLYLAIDQALMDAEEPPAPSQYANFANIARSARQIIKEDYQNEGLITKSLLLDHLGDCTKFPARCERCVIEQGLMELGLLFGVEVHDMLEVVEDAQ